MKPGKTNRQSLQPTIEKAVILSDVIKEETDLEKHIKDSSVHSTQEEKNKLNILYQNEPHFANDDIHVTEKQKVEWDSKETSEQSQAKADVVKSLLVQHKKDLTIHMTKKEKDLFNDKYTRAEVNNKIKNFQYGITWLKEVSTFNDILIRYKTPKLHDTCNVTTLKKTYTFNGTEWVESNIQYIPSATASEDGLLVSEDKSKLDSIEIGANNYIHPDDINTRHVTDEDISKWNSKANSSTATIMTNGLLSKYDKKKLDSIEENANNYIHPDKHNADEILETSDKQFVSKINKDNWDAKETTTGSQEKATLAEQSANRYTNNKIAGILHTSTETLEVINDLVYRLKSADTLQNLIDLINKKVSLQEFEDHTLNSSVHMTADDKHCMKSVKTLLENRVNPDWLQTDPGSLSYIKNKPEYLKAQGGDSDTVKGKKLLEIMKNKRSNTLVIGSCDKMYTLEDVDVLCDGINDSDIITTAIEKSGCGKIIFREGEYNINSPIELRLSSYTIQGMGKSTVFNKLFDTNDTMFTLIGNGNIIEDLYVLNKDKSYAITIKGNNNNINNIDIKYGSGIMIIDGSLNRIVDNTISDTKINAICVSTVNDNCYGNMINSNYISNSNIGIGLISTEKYNKSNIVKGNIILNNNIGVLLSNDVAKPYNQFNNISDNTIYRGNGIPSDYTDSQEPIKIDNGSFNAVHDNISPGKQIKQLGNNDYYYNLWGNK